MEWNSHRDRRFHLWIFFSFFFFSTLAMRWSEGCSFLSFSLSLFSSFRQPRNRKIGTNGSRCFPPAISGPLDLIRLLPFFSLSVFFSFHRFLSPLHGFHPSFARYFSPAILSSVSSFFHTLVEKVPRTTVFSRFAIRRALERVGSNNTVLGSRYRRSRRSSPYLSRRFGLSGFSIKPVISFTRILEEGRTGQGELTIKPFFGFVRLAFI